MRRDVATLWVGGAAVLVLAAGHLAFGGMEREQYELAQYVLMGVALPPLVVLLGPAGPARARWRTGLGIVGLVGATAFLARVFGRAMLVDAPFAAVHWYAGAVVLAAREGHDRAARFVAPFRSGRAAVVPFLLLLVAWVVSVRLMWWANFESKLRFAAFDVALVAAFALAFAGCGGEPAPRGPARTPWIDAVGRVVVLALFAVGSFRTNGLFSDVNSLYHWSYFVGTAASVREGGWLLWDVPSIYGFLNVLAIVALPVRSLWQSLYLVNGALTLVSAAIVFRLLRWRDGPVAWAMALVVTVSAVFLLPGSIRGFYGPSWFPSVGPLRFLWCHVLLGAVWLAWRAPTRRARVLVAGCVAWAVGMLWSSESAVIATATWVPAYLLLVGREVAERRGGRGALVRWWLLPPALLAGAIAVVEAYYRGVAGHGPDWYAFVEASAWTTAGHEVTAIQPTGGTWCFVLLFCVVGTIAGALVRARRWDGLALATAAGGASWATFGYFVPLSHEFSLLSLQPVMTAVAGIALLLSARALRGPTAFWLRMAVVPALTIVMAAGYGFPKRIGEVLPPEVTSPVDRLLPVTDPAAASLLDAAGVRPGDPVVHADLFDFLIRPEKPYRPAGTSPYVGHREWLPFDLCTGEKVPVDRRPLYFRRWFARRPHEAGWLMTTKGVTEDLSSLLAPTHHPTRTLENERFRLTRWEPRASE